MLLIAHSEEFFYGEAVYFSSNALPVKATKYEPAGHAFHSAALRLKGHFVELFKSEDDEKDSSVEKEHFYVHSDSYGSRANKKSTGEKKQQDHYALLGLGHLRYLATEDQIRKSYRESALRHHPDKHAALILAEETEAAKEAKKEKIESHFKAIQEAYEVLIDPIKRRIFDSTDEFDDKIPNDCAPHEFFKVFAPAFLRNGRWSSNQPAPMLGDDKTSIEEVDRFYDFWYSFKSWREFPHDDEFDLEQAESRDHKRWMERQNAKLSEKARKEESARVRTLVDNAYKRDPRILRRKEDQKADKQRKKEAKFLAKKMQEEEAARIADMERRKKEEEEKTAAEAALNQKKLKEKEKKLLRKERNRLRTLANPILCENFLDITDDDVEHVCSSLDKEQLKILNDQMEGKEELEKAKLLKGMLFCDEVNLKNNDSIPMKRDAPCTTPPAQKPETVWSKTEIELLRKGMQRYPKGTSRRWEVISEYIGTKRSVEEILKATKSVLLQKPDSSKAFDSFLEKRKPAQTIASPLTTRGEEISDVSDDNSAKKESLSSHKVPEHLHSNGDSLNLVKQSAASNGLPSNTTADEETVLIKSDGVPGNIRNNTKKSVSSNGKLPDSSIHKSNGAVKSKVENGVHSCDGDTWSEVHEKALIQALKVFPKDTSQRWERVAAAVPGKTVNQCKKKMASLKENFRNMKN